MSVCARLVGDPCGPGSFAVQSRTDEGRWYAVEWVNAEARWCSCQGFQQRNDCRHVQAVETAWREEHEAALSARRADPAAVEQARERIKELREIFS